MNEKRNNYAVSELIGTFLLLSIAILAFSIIYLGFTNDEGPEIETHVTIVGDIVRENITLIHRGGESLNGEDPIKFMVADTEISCNISKYLIDTNANGKWDFSELIKFNFLKETNTSYEEFLNNIDKFEFIDSEAIDLNSNAIEFLGPIYSKYRSDLGVYASISNNTPILGDTITITVTLWCYGGDVAAAGDVYVNCSLPEGLTFLGYSSDQGSYNNKSGLWHLGNIRMDESPYTLDLTVRVDGIPFHEDTQLAIIFSGDEYTSGSVSVWQNTYLNALKFALDPVKFGIIPTDGSVELTIVACGWNDPPHAEAILSPTIITIDNAKDIAQDLPNYPYPGGELPISSAIRLSTDLMYNSDNYQSAKKQTVLIISSGNPNCIWDPLTADGYGGITSNNTAQVRLDTINAKDYLNEKLHFNMLNDELNAITVAKTVEYRYSNFFNNSIVLPQPGNIYDMDHPILDPGWVFEVEPGKDAFQESLNLILKLLLNSVSIDVFISDTTTIDVISSNNAYYLYIEPRIV
jgi:uncharacterized repeat protein (TIGR01451 family)